MESWISDLIGRNARKAEEARRRIAEIRDPLAASALAGQLEKVNFLAPKLILIEKLGDLDCQAASDALLKCAMEDENDQVRDACWDQLSRDGSPAVVASLSRNSEAS